MKKSSNILVILSVLMLGISSCSRTLETEPLERQFNNTVFNPMDSLGRNASLFLANVYASLPSGYNRIDGDMLATMTDDAVPSSQSNMAWRIATGGYTMLFNPDNDWAAMYTGIRKATVFINNIDSVPVPSGKIWKAEARFLRAFFYFELVKRYGGVPLLGDKLRSINDELEIPRSSFSESIKYIVDQCDICAPNLLKDPLTGSNYGHASQGAAMALKARALLYAASPLNNPNNDLSLWENAADAAKAVMDLNVFKLLPNFKEVFITMPNPEVIFTYSQGTGNSVEKNNGPAGYTTAGGSGARTSPTQELVDAFNMQNGLPITDAASGYNPNDPYTGRDPRFYATILYNGAQWLGRAVETYEGGRDKPGTSVVQTLTSYYLRKFMGNYENTTTYGTHPYDFIHFRYAGILLDYAEALNEYAGPSPEVYEQLIAIRKRAGIASGGDNLYGLKADMDKDEMRQAIHHERRVELAFEEQRYWDMRRWKIADDVYTKPLHGLDISVYLATGELIYQKIEVLKPVFLAPKMYRYPIPYNIMVTNDSLVQNPDW